jgi:AraC-like DNA-binding protein
MSETAGLGSLPEAALTAIAELAEPRPPGRLFYCAANSSEAAVKADGRDIPTHVAHCLELMFVQRGSMGVATPGQLLHLVPGHLLVIDIGVEHGEIRDDAPDVVFFAIHGTNVQFDRVSPDHPSESLSLIGRTDLTWIVDAIRREFARREPGFDRAVHALLEYLACILSRRIQRGSHLDVSWVWVRETIDNKAWQAMRTVLGHLAAHFREDTDVEALSRSVGYSSSHLNRFFMRHLGKTMSKCLRDFRIAHGRGLLLHTEIPISDVAQMVGYSDAASFRRAFESATGTKLKGYRKGGSGRERPLNTTAWSDVPQPGS